MNLTLKIWRQQSASAEGSMQTYQVKDVSADMSFLEMLDGLNEQLTVEGGDPVAFDSDCREGICGSCSLVINGSAHGPLQTTTCQLQMRSFSDGEEIVIEPWRATAFPVIRDLVVDRSAFDRIMQAGGYVSVGTGEAPEANSIPVPKPDADLGFENATCIGCGACVAACPNGAASLFTSAKITHLGLMPQGAVDQNRRTLNMVAQMDAEGFGNCTLVGNCTSVCPKGIPMTSISTMNKAYIKAIRAR